MPGVRNVIAIASGKGGVGKSTTAVNLALALAREGARVGILDADIYGPSQPRMLGLLNRTLESHDGKTFEPLMAHGLQVSSIGFMIDEEKPLIWRGPMVTQALQQLAFQTHWNDLDYLLVDLPPGTGDAQLTLTQKVPLAGAIIITTPQDVALADARKGLKMFEAVGVPVLGVIENMSTFICPCCDKETEIFGAGGGEQAGAGKWRHAARQAAARRPYPRRDRWRTADRGCRSGWPDRAALPGDRPAGRPCAGAAAEGPARQVRHHPGRGPQMSIRPDRWIRRMAEQHGMIEPFEPGQVREVEGKRVISFGTSSYGYDVRCARQFKVFTNINSTHRRSQGLRQEQLRGHGGRCLHHPAQLLCAGIHRGVLPHSAHRADGVPGQVHLCPLRHHRQRHAAGAGVGRACDAGVLQHHAAAGTHLCQ